MEELQLPDDFDLANILWEIKKNMAEGENNASSEHTGTEGQVQSGESAGSEKGTEPGGSGSNDEGRNTDTRQPPEVTTVTPSESAIPTPPEQFGDPGDYTSVAKKSGERTRFKRHFARSTNK